MALLSGANGTSIGANGDLMGGANCDNNRYWRQGLNGDRHWQSLAPFKLHHLIHSMAILSLLSPLRVSGSFRDPMAPIDPMAPSPTMAPVATMVNMAQMAIHSREQWHQWRQLHQYASYSLYMVHDERNGLFSYDPIYHCRQ